MSFDFTGEFLTKPVPESTEPMTVERIGELLTKMHDNMCTLDALILQCDDKDESIGLACTFITAAKHILRNCLTKDQRKLIVNDIIKDPSS